MAKKDAQERQLEERLRSTAVNYTANNMSTEELVTRLESLLRAAKFIVGAGGWQKNEVQS